MGVRRRAPRCRDRPAADAVLRLLAARAPQDAPAAADHLHLRPRRQPDRDPALDGGPDDHPALGHAAPAPARGDRRRGQGVLPAPRHRRHRDLPRRVDRPRLGPDRPGRLDADPAARQERLRGSVLRGSQDRRRDLRGPAAHARAEGAREPARDQGRARVHQGRDLGQVPEYRLLRPRRVRRPGGRADVLPEGRFRALGARVGAARRHGPEPLVLRPGRARAGSDRAAELRPRADGVRGVPHRRARGPARGPSDQGEPHRCRPELPRQARLLPRLHAARSDLDVRRGPGVQRRAAGHDHARSADAALCRGGGRQPAAHAGRSRGGGRRDRSPQRRRPRDVRGEELRGLEGEPRDRRRRFGAAGGLGVQAVHARDRDRAGLLVELALERPGLDHDPGPRVLHGRRALAALERGRRGERRLHAAAGDGVLREHRLRAGRVGRDARMRSWRRRTTWGSGRRSSPCARSRSGRRRSRRSR